jgi:hypothetical protein
MLNRIDGLDDLWSQLRGNRGLDFRLRVKGGVWASSSRPRWVRGSVIVERNAI